jgi:predicted PurR-regulated permease PerM
MKKLLYILLALALFQSTAYLPYKFFLPMLVGSILIIITQIKLYFYDRKKTTSKL